jgi:dihydroorotate dehydrogenase electron transfer subunit
VGEEILRYIELLKYFKYDKINSPEHIDDLLNNAFAIFPKSNGDFLSEYIENKEFRNLAGKKLSNKKSYNTFCFNILSLLFEKLGDRICFINKKYFDSSFLSLNSNYQSFIIQDEIISENCAFVVKSKKTNLIFSFGHLSQKKLNDLSNYIYLIDNNKYENIHIIIFKNSVELNEARRLNKANVYKRCFFTSFEIICSKAIEINKESYKKTFSLNWDFYHNKPKNLHEANLHKINIIDNIPVGTEESKLYKMTFESKDSIDILPGQFIMIDTLRERQTEFSGRLQPKIHNSISSVHPSFHNDLNTNRLSYLKRPFGIYRTYNENFSYDCSSKLILEKEWSSILYTIKPNKFEILYKVLDGGVGTNELTKLVKDDKIEILAPLGKIFDLREILKEEIDEVHIVGGGVGIAPLVYLVQILRFFGIRVKAFIGVEKYSSLTYFDADIDPQSFTGSGRNAKIYVDDLRFLGLSETSDIYLSILSDADDEQTIDIRNVFKGCFITEPYANYVKEHQNSNILTFTCGPTPMMHKVHNIASQYNIKSFVLMEKRMACGIGVCFSCVCKTVENGENHYSRVCIDGPIIESKQINWNE